MSILQVGRYSNGILVLVDRPLRDLSEVTMADRSGYVMVEIKMTGTSVDKGKL